MIPLTRSTTVLKLHSTDTYRKALELHVISGTDIDRSGMFRGVGCHCSFLDSSTVNTFSGERASSLGVASAAT